MKITRTILLRTLLRISLSFTVNIHRVLGFLYSLSVLFECRRGKMALMMTCLFAFYLFVYSIRFLDNTNRMNVMTSFIVNCVRKFQSCWEILSYVLILTEILAKIWKFCMISDINYDKKGIAFSVWSFVLQWRETVECTVHVTHSFKRVSD